MQTMPEIAETIIHQFDMGVPRFQNCWLDPLEIIFMGKPIPKDTIEARPLADKFIANTCADIRIGGTKAAYNSSHDAIKMPFRELFTDTIADTATNNFYEVLLHELVHWTGHQSRLKRLTSQTKYIPGGKFFEECVAEMGSAYLMQKLGLRETLSPNTAASLYSLFRDEKADFFNFTQKPDDLIRQATKTAQAAVDFLGIFQPK